MPNFLENRRVKFRAPFYLATLVAMLGAILAAGPAARDRRSRRHGRVPLQERARRRISGLLLGRHPQADQRHSAHDVFDQLFKPIRRLALHG